MSRDQAPPVRYPVSSSGLQTALALGLGSLAVTSFSIWVWLSDSWGLHHLIVLLIAVLAGLWVFRDWQVQPTQDLYWDGRDWRLCEGENAVVVQVQVVLDFQQAYLLHLVHLAPRRGQHWVWPQASRSPALWPALRRALVASAGRRGPQAT